ncbi:MAG: GvpL/GvpF family gas vesicle protein [Gemmatimonadaceae bacterium]
MLYGVVPAQGSETGSRLAGVEVVAVRQVAALVESNSLGKGAPAPARASSPALAQDVARYRQVVEEAFRDRAVVPAPFATLFRSRLSVARWLELHHSPLLEALDFVSERAVMRVRLRADSAPAHQSGGAAAAGPVDGALWQLLRALKADAVAAIPVVPRADQAARHPLDAECAYLVDRDAWPAFVRKVENLTSAYPTLRVEPIGPLPPYDFVSLDFGG